MKTKNWLYEINNTSEYDDHPCEDDKSQSQGLDDGEYVLYTGGPLHTRTVHKRQHTYGKK